jgi:hypothetical protein
MALWTLSSKGSPELGSLGWPGGTSVAKLKPVAGSDAMPGFLPNCAGPLLFPLIIGAMVGSEALTSLE